MFKQFIRAACIVSVLGFATAGYAADKISPEVGKPLNDAIASAKANDFKTALTHVQEAQAVPNRTPFEDYRINQILTNVAFGLQDMATADQAAEAAADSLAMPDEDKKGMLHNALLLSAQAKHWQRTIAYGQQLEAMNALDDVAEADMAVALYNSGDQTRALQYAQKSIDAAKVAGKQPDQAAMEIMMNSQAKSNPAAAAQTLENIVVQTNSVQDWGRLIEYNFGTPGMEQTMAMNLYRLEFVTHSLSKENAGLAGKLAIQLGYFGDSVAILESAGLGGADMAAARTGAARDQGSLSSQIAAAGRGSGQVSVKVAEALYGYGRFADAEELARGAMSKGGMKIPAEASILVGMALVGQNKNAEAVQAFNAVTGNQAATKTAHLWSLYAQHQVGGNATQGATH